ncbi:MAG: enoyl-CoA hydratase/isomerase family protein [Firmicutes bacterium]|nr:enoyl-CoA hydratase/isomerase family protein [Bacillota bacterium]
MPVRVELAGRRADIVLDRPEALNALDGEMITDLARAMAKIEDNPDVRVVVLRGSGNSFCAGADLRFVMDLLDRPDDLERFTRLLGETFNALEFLDRPVIGALHGYVLAGGLELALCCDLLIAAQDARIGDQHVNFGLIPGGGASVRLPRAVGLRRAAELLYSGRWLSGREAAEMGLVNRAVPREQLSAAVDELAGELAAKSPDALKAMKQLVRRTIHMPSEALELERSTFVRHVTTSPDVGEGLRAFREKRRPVF